MVSTSHSYCSCTSPTQCIDRDPGRYLVAIHRLFDERDGRVPTGAVSEHLGVSPSSATEMVKKLADIGLTDHEPYRGVTLTADGHRIACELDRRQHVVRTFFTSALATSLDKETEYQFGYLLPESGIERLRELVEVGVETEPTK